MVIMGSPSAFLEMTMTHLDYRNVSSGWATGWLANSG